MSFLWEPSRMKTTESRPLPVLGQTGPESSSPQPVWSDAPVVGFVSLGCAKNLVDSEMMLANIAESGAIVSGDEAAADTIVVNTCGFLSASRDEALDVLRELAERKRAGTLRRIVVAGCLVQRDGRKLLEAIPEIDALVGVNNREDVASVVWELREREEHPPQQRPRGLKSAARDRDVELYLGDYHAQPWSDQGRLRLTPRHYAYVRISEGCNQKCTFCTIPSIRGPMHSKSPDQLVAECRELTADGAREIILIGQDTTSYGADIGYQPGLAGLLRRLDAEISEARWIRLMYVYPSVMTDAIIDAIAESERFVKYIDIPLQHINDRVLKSMHRRVTRARTEALLEKLRTRIAGVTIRTTFIVGFPGETESEFAELVEFVRDFRFDMVGAFQFSLEAQTPSGRMAGQIEDAVKAERYERLMLAQQEIALSAARGRIGQSFKVVVDGDADERGVCARHAGQAPEVDSVCLLPDGGFEPGEFVAVRCVETDDYDLAVQPLRHPQRGTGPRDSGP